MLIFSIETSCDETACALVRDGTVVLNSTLATSEALHKATGGVVPEVAARKQVEFILPVIEATFREARIDMHEIDAIAVTVGPGLIGSLLVGVEAGKALALGLNKPLIPVNHLVGHIYGNYIGLSDPNSIVLPAVVLIVSGGHTDLVLMHGHGDLEYLGGTVDDAAGEAFDKTARLLGLSKYLGGVELSKMSSLCTQPHPKLSLPRPKIHDDDYDFSFSGLKSAVKRVVDLDTYSCEQIAYEFEHAVVDVLTKKTMKAALEKNVRSILLGGGVSANKLLRESLSSQASSQGISFYTPPLSLCGDNAVYIASCAYFLLKNENKLPPVKDFSKIHADPSLTIVSRL